ncbi:MAG TPA: hypothetical protein VMU07_00105 [Candidatus Paceibacterota bacterium]|nr:hypothetical protein [Candidatus Paceibacterota bacterium]
MNHSRIRFIAFALVAFIAMPIAAAHAYATATTSMPLAAPTTGTSSFDIGSSFGNLFAPFEAFFNNLMRSMGGSQPILGPGSTGGTPSTPVITLSNGTSGTAPQIVNQWFTNLGNMSLVDFFKLILNGVMWVLGLAIAFVQWIANMIR